MLPHRLRTSGLSIAGQREIVPNRLLEMAEEEPLVLLEAGMLAPMATTIRQAIPMEIEATGAYTQMTMWQECRGLTIRHRSQNLMSITITAQSRATAIPE